MIHAAEPTVGRRLWSDGDMAAGGGLIDANLSPEARAAGHAAELALIEPVGRRAVAVFLGRDDYEKVQIIGGLMANLLLECLPRFIRQCGGQRVLAVRFTDRGDVINAIQSVVKVDGQDRKMLQDGHLFIHLPGERVVVSAEQDFRCDDVLLAVTVRSNVDSAGFLARWQEYARRTNYLRGRAFFADGTLIEHKRAYTWDDVVLADNVRRAVSLHVQGFLRHSRRMRELGMKARRGLILAGPPGTGKTLLGKVLAHELKDVSFMWVSPRHVRNGQSFESILAVARYVAPTVVFIEDIDLFGEDRESKGGGPCLGELMNQLDGTVDNQDIVTIATTNHLDVVEKALRARPGRFDRVLRMDGMDERGRRGMLARLLAKAEIAPGDVEHLVKATADYTGAQIEELVNTIYLLSVDQSEPDSDSGDDQHRPIPLERGLLDAALVEMAVERKARMGFAPAR